MNTLDKIINLIAWTLLLCASAYIFGMFLGSL